MCIRDRHSLFFKMAAAVILNCWMCKILLADGVVMGHTHHCTKLRQNRSFRCRDIAMFRIFKMAVFKMAAAAILDFSNREIFLVIRVQRVETHLHAKFCQNRSIGCEDINIFWFFKLAAVCHIGFDWGIFGPPTVSTCGSLSLCKIWLWSMQ